MGKDSRKTERWPVRAALEMVNRYYYRNKTKEDAMNKGLEIIGMLMFKDTPINSLADAGELIPIKSAKELRRHLKGKVIMNIQSDGIIFYMGDNFSKYIILAKDLPDPFIFDEVMRLADKYQPLKPRKAGGVDARDKTEQAAKDIFQMVLEALPCA